jgi:YesN/AraC family two-component response regulator
MTSEGIKILVVDDEKYIRELLAGLLEDQYIIETAEDGEQAVKKLALGPFDVVLTDIKMPNMDGFGLLKAVKRDYPDTAVVMMTGFSQNYTIREALTLGAEEYLPKPFRLEEVLMVVQSAYDKAVSRRRLKATAR